MDGTPTNSPPWLVGLNPMDWTLPPRELSVGQQRDPAVDLGTGWTRFFVDMP